MDRTRANAFEMKIQLIHVEPFIWRRILVPTSFSLIELHAVIQGAMGWQDYHLHMYEIGDNHFEIPDGDSLGPEEGYLDERQFHLEALLEVGSEFFYVYDFGDKWNHLLQVEALRTTDFLGRYAICLDGERACPPEDSGGAYRYWELLEALRDPSHTEHRSMREWAGNFDPEVFSVPQSNALISAICSLYRERDPSLFMK